MSDPSTLSFTLTYAGTLGVAFLMFLAQTAVVGVLLVLAGVCTVLMKALQIIPRLLFRS